ncbi:hypothetical protein OOT46_02750 [Aquabacterium sp. A7-Y]|uniref:hypothetical protein n=1 Tax=Aquabacterium sp. A7-Y TaxID=1349605 RepID=UPI00223CBDBF|nr:hypothetical protein [Aquabacterium sp. A7-Y]MCW7536772.1 hypothetical protein [Aquabacterium sp. A7-Y]
MSKSASLQAEMDRHGLTDEDLLGEVLSVAPKASAVIVTGSLSAGFGNQHSDIDLVCIIADGHFSKLPIMIYRGDAKIDCEYWMLPDLVSAKDHLTQSHMLEAVGDLRLWKKLTRALLSLTKLNIAHVLHTTEEIKPLFDHVQSPAFAESVRLWWGLESLRLLTAARQVLPAAPRLANNLYSESVFAALSAQATQQSLLFGKKWLGAKLRRMEDQRGLALYHLALMLPGGSEHEVRERCAQLDDAVACSATITPWLSRPLELTWWLAPSARLSKFADCVLLWQGKAGYEFPRRHAAESWQPGGVIGNLQGADREEHLVASLFKDGLTWPGLVMSARNPE